MENLPTFWEKLSAIFCAYYRSMDAKLILRLLAAFMGFALSVFAQIDGAKFAIDLRAKYGPPLSREVFMASPGEMVVDYATNDHVCRIQLPPMGPGDQHPDVRSTKFIDDFLLTLVPLSMRGKELRKIALADGPLAVSMVEYGNVSISGTLQGPERTGVTVPFKNEKCRDQSAP